MYVTCSLHKTVMYDAKTHHEKHIPLANAPLPGLCGLSPRSQQEQRWLGYSWLRGKCSRKSYTTCSNSYEERKNVGKHINK